MMIFLGLGPFYVLKWIPAWPGNRPPAVLPTPTMCKFLKCHMSVSQVSHATFIFHIWCYRSSDSCSTLCNAKMK